MKTDSSPAERSTEHIGPVKSSLRFDFANAIYDESMDVTGTPTAARKAKHLLHRRQLVELEPRLQQLREQLRREVESPQERARAPQPADHGFITLPAELLGRVQSPSEPATGSLVPRIATAAQRVRELADRVVFLGIGGSYLGARALAEALLPSWHNERPAEWRRGTPRYYFEGNGLDNDTLAELIALLRPHCIPARNREERTALVVVSKSGTTLETAAAFRVLWQAWKEWHPPELTQSLVLIVTTCDRSSKLFDLAIHLGVPEYMIFPMPDDVGGRFSIFTSAGLVPAAILGLDIARLLQGAADATQQFFEQPIGQNYAWQYAAINHLYFAHLHKPIRVLSVWSKKLEALGLWYDQLVSESLGKNETGPTPITAVQTRDLHSRGQQHQEGSRDRIIHNLFVEHPNQSPIALGHLELSADGLETLADKTFPDLLRAAWLGTNRAYAEDARPTTDWLLSRLDEYTLGQLMQTLMLATIVEGRLLGINPYGQPGVEAYKRNMRQILGLP